jgi:hypothetical protein
MGGQRKRVSRPERILNFGEDENDTRAIRELLLGLRPDLDGKVKHFRSPPVLIKDTRPENIPDRVDRIVALVKAEQIVANVVGVFVHEDCDAPEPAHRELTSKIENAFAVARCPAHAVTPAWEMEAWWFLWPAATKRVRPTWRGLDPYLGRDVGKIANAKEELRRALRPTGARKPPDYRESDAPLIATAVRELNLAALPGGHSDSYRMFRDSAERCGRTPA